MHWQINLMKFVESNKFDKVYRKIWNIFVWSNVLKSGVFKFIKLVGWKISNQILNHHKEEKNEENNTTNKSTWNILVARFSFDVLASLIFVIYFVICGSQVQIACRTIQGLSSNLYTFSPSKRHWERRIYT